MSEYEQDRTKEDYPMTILRGLFDGVKEMGKPGVGYWIAKNNSGKDLSYRIQFIAADGSSGKDFMYDGDSLARCNFTAMKWMLELESSSTPAWEVLAAAADDDGNFNMIPIYPDDPSSKDWDFSDTAGVMERARTLLDM